jgi:hypothetical protein
MSDEPHHTPPPGEEPQEAEPVTVAPEVHVEIHNLDDERTEI